MVRLSVLVALAWILILLPLGAEGAELLFNGNFDGSPIGSGWVQDDGGSGYPLIVDSDETPVTAHSAPNLAWLGGLLSNTSSITQQVVVPSGTVGLKLTGLILIGTQETGGVYDVMSADLLTTDNVVLESFHQWNNTGAGGGWNPFEYTATGDYSGQTVRLRFRSVNDASFVTNFFLDTIQLQATPAVAVTTLIEEGLRLSPAIPNPTRGATRLTLDLPTASRVRWSVLDASGRLVRGMAEERMAQGMHDLAWDGTDARGQRAAVGVYFFRVETEERTFHRPIVLTR